MATIMGNPNQDDLGNSEKCDPSIMSNTQPVVVEVDTQLDRRLLWKRDLVLIPIMGVLYLVLFVDRTNIANARALGIGSPTGLESSLGMPSNGYNVALVRGPDKMPPPMSSAHHASGDKPAVTQGIPPA